MALLDLCRLDEKINLKPSDSLVSINNDVLGYTQNFNNCIQLATPPFANVSKGYYAEINIHIFYIIKYVLFFQPVETLAQFNTKDETGRQIKIEFDHGTTTLGFRYKVRFLFSSYKYFNNCL